MRRTGTGNGGLQMLYLLIGNRAPCKQGFAALQVGAQTRQLSFSLGQFGLTAFDRRCQCPVVGKNRTHLARRIRQLRLSLIQRNARIGGVKPDQQLSLLDLLRVIGLDRDDRARNLWGDLHHIAVNIGVVRAHPEAGNKHPVRAIGKPGQHADDGEHDQLTPAPGLRYRGNRGGRVALEHVVLAHGAGSSKAGGYHLWPPQLPSA